MVEQRKEIIKGKERKRIGKDLKKINATTLFDDDFFFGHRGNKLQVTLGDHDRSLGHDTDILTFHPRRYKHMGSFIVS